MIEDTFELFYDICVRHIWETNFVDWVFVAQSGKLLMDFTLVLFLDLVYSTRDVNDLVFSQFKVIEALNLKLVLKNSFDHARKSIA